jgi:deazaflavin-dependent oxidoreductase (nitroreductase family)
MAADPTPGAQFCYLTTRGRKTGRDHRIEIWFALQEGTVFMLSGGRDESDWVLNLMATPEVSIEIAGETRRTTARVVDPGSEEDPLARRLLASKYQPGYGEDLSRWAREALPVAVEWEAGGDGR